MTKKGENYKKELDDLFSNYVDGRYALQKATGWNVAIPVKPECKDKKIPTTFMALADEAIRIVAQGKYGLDTYDNVIEIINAEQMRNAYASDGMPISYDHWSFGKKLIQMDKNYNEGKMGLAYEIVINTDPAIAYCMDSNSKAMQMLVIAHASYGHNSFFKGNHLFRQFTKADKIIDELKVLKNLVEECERIYGPEETEALLDACHALQYHSVNRYNRPPARTPEEDAARRERLERERLYHFDLLMDTTTSTAKKFSKAANDNDGTETLPEPDENLLNYIATYAPALEPKKRELLHQFCKKAQYFYPQMQTQLMNEGWASFWHHNILHDLYDLDVIDEGMMLEVLDSHSSVIFQPDFDTPYFGGINVYALGIAMFQDLKRVCENPTDEDREWFKGQDIAGNPDWISVVTEAMKNHKSESFVMQYLSPKVMRDFHLFAFRDDDMEDELEISAIHDDDGYKRIRDVLASQYRLADTLPDIEVTGYKYKTDRSLILQHKMHNRKPLEENDMWEVMKHIHYLWGFPVVLNSVEPDGSIESTMECPPKPKAKDPSPGNWYYP